MKQWNPETDLTLPLRTTEPTEFDAVGLFAGTDAEIANRFAVMAACQRHRFGAVTDRFDRAREWFAWADAYDARNRWVTNGPTAMLLDKHCLTGEPVSHALPPDMEDTPAEWYVWPLPNLMIGTTIATQKEADERLAKLAEIPARWRCVRVEPSEDIYLDNLKLVGNRLTGWSSAPRLLWQSSADSQVTTLEIRRWAREDGIPLPRRGGPRTAGPGRSIGRPRTGKGTQYGVTLHAPVVAAAKAELRRLDIEGSPAVCMRQLMQGIASGDLVVARPDPLHPCP